MNPIAFSKLSGTGNDFIIVDNRSGAVSENAMPGFVRRVCRRAVSVGADGVIFIRHHSELDFAWNFFNSDGGETEMCGNGARCAARYAFERGIAKNPMSFMTEAGPIKAKVSGDGIVKVLLTKAYDYRKFELRAPDRMIDGFFLNTGVPHAIVICEDVEAVNVAELGAFIRHAKQFAPEGVNANFVEKVNEHELLIRTFERGVEDETLACGTGCVAAALCLAENGIVYAPVKLTVRSREKLTVDFSQNSPLAGDAWLEGAVHWIYDGVLKDEDIKD
jgi:diaminopimelate epimerase